jgi:hypothetical protein
MKSFLLAWEKLKMDSIVSVGGNFTCLSEEALSRHCSEELKEVIEVGRKKLDPSFFSIFVSFYPNRAKQEVSRHCRNLVYKVPHSAAKSR